MPGDNLLAAASRVWNDVCGDLKEADEPADGTLMPVEDLKKVVKWLQGTVTKFGASAAVADGEDRDKALKPIAEEVIKAFTAAAGTLLALRNGAGPSLIRELKDNGSSLAEAMDALGKAVGKESMAACAGKALERVKFLERTSTQNRAAIRRRLLKSLAQLRDANREMQEELRMAEASSKSQGGGYNEDNEDSDDDMLDDLGDAPLEPSERRVVQGVLRAATLLEDLLKEASSSCLPSSGSSPTAAAESSPSLQELEASVGQADVVTGCIDALAADSVGGMDVEACKKSVEKLRAASTALTQSYSAVPASELQGALDEIQEAVTEAEAAMAAAEED
eukprot:TRINITY_DN32087_c0_g1_i1.p1 TRINITY_DN32087_c0_g1~~TRINITY_DN32087_c0_g1_i1.p1  ORF type:complete len:344 (+),score=103.77 TRINITY_DN32087_c0_g1_i1:27-1034(+)